MTIFSHSLKPANDRLALVGLCMLAIGFSPAPALGRSGACLRLKSVTAPWSPAAKRARAKVRPLVTPKGLRRRVGFWSEVWGRRGDSARAIVDARKPWIVHAWVSCEALSRRACDQRLQSKFRALRRQLQRNYRRYPARMIKRFGGRTLARTAGHRLRVVRGHKDALARAFDRGSPHLAQLQEVFAAQGLPPSLARLSIVESLFQLGSVSHAGAVGLFQFVKSTAQERILVAHGVDERRDPMRSGYAAASYLAKLKRRFGLLELAVTAYNAGPTRLARMMRHQHTRRLVTLIAHPSDPKFGFDAQNYYAQIVAVSRLTARRAIAPRGPALRHLRVRRRRSLTRLARCVHRRRSALARANPALGAAIRRGRLAVPAGYLLALPSPRGPKLALRQGEVTSLGD